MKKLLIAAAALLLLCISCEGVSGKLLVIEGNYHSSRGRYTKAITAYQKALSHEAVAPYAHAGLGTAYYHLEETKAALQRFEDVRFLLDRLPPNEHRELRYRTSYNSGMAQFSQGDFSASAESFREALRVDSGRLEAKRNLELSLRQAQRENTSGSRAEFTPEEIQRKAVLFDYLGRREQSQWRSREWQAGDEYEGPDY